MPKVLSDLELEQLEMLRRCHVALWNTLAQNPVLDKSAAFAMVADSADSRKLVDSLYSLAPHVSSVVSRNHCFACGADKLIREAIYRHALELHSKRLFNQLVTEGVTLYGISTLRCGACPLKACSARLATSGKVEMSPLAHFSYCLSGIYATWCHRKYGTEGKACLSAVIRDTEWVSDPFNPA